jgi:hypothetical protein
MADKAKKGRPTKAKEVGTDNPEQVGTEVVKAHRNRPDLAKFGEENCKPGDNTRYLRYAMASMDLPPIDISDPKQVESRIKEYFEYCGQNDRKPNMKGLGNWLGASRETVNCWKKGEYRTATHTDLIKKACDVLEELWVDYMQNGKINPASGCFLGKNMFGYRDVQDVVVTPGQPLGEDADASTLADKYKTAMPDIETDGVEKN